MNSLLWGLMLVVEGFFLTSVTLTILFWRACRVQRRLRAEIVALRHVGAPTGQPQPSPAVPPPVVPDAISVQTDAEVQDELTTFVESDSKLNEVAERLREKNRSLQQQLEALLSQMTLSPLEREKLGELRAVLQELEQELEAFQIANLQLKQDLSKTTRLVRQEATQVELLERQQSALQKSIKELRMANTRMTREAEMNENLMQRLKKENQELQGFKDEAWSLRTKLAAREADLMSLQAEHEALSEEYDTLSGEYQRIFSSFQKA